jgi:hypothetical protein
MARPDTLVLVRLLTTDVRHLVSLPCPNFPQRGGVRLELDTEGEVGQSPKRTMEVTGCGV